MTEEARKIVETIKEAFDVFSAMELPAEEQKIEITRDAAMTLIAQLEAQMPRWISVKAGLPKAFKDVDIAFGNADSIGFYSNVAQRWYRTMDGNGVPVHGVHHWKYRDEPPKENEGGNDGNERTAAEGMAEEGPGSDRG